MRRRIIAAVITALLAIGIFTVASLGYREITGPHSLTAVFPKTTGIYVGDDVRVAGVKVGTITGIHPQGTTVRMTMDIDRGVKVPTGAKAVIIAQNLVANRYVQLTPSYRGTGTTLADGAIIPLGRTEIPVEWDEIKKQLTRLATDLGPDEKDAARNPDSVVGRFIGAAADTLDGNGESMSSALRELTDLSRLLGENTGNITTTISNLSLLVKAVSSSSEQITSFEHRLATVSSVLDGSRTDIDSALTTLAGRWPMCAGLWWPTVTAPPNRYADSPRSPRTWWTATIRSSNCCTRSPTTCRTSTTSTARTPEPRPGCSWSTTSPTRSSSCARRSRASRT